MLNDLHLFTAQAYFAERAYDLRDFAKPKRYTLQEIQSFEISETHADRAEVEAFIAAVFYSAYGAQLKSYMPKLIALRDQHHNLMAAFGMREASKSALFLEQYLEHPIEIVASNYLNQTILRSDITEIGNLAVANPRNSGILISHVIQHSIDAGVQYCVATAHHTLQNGLIKGGVDVLPLHPVDPHRLPDNEIQNWGSYYDNKPQVIAVRRTASY